MPAIMSAPTVVTASVTTTSIPLTWSAPTGTAAGGTGLTVDTYEIQVSSDSGTTWTSLSNTITGTTYTHTVTAGSTTYFYQIRAHNAYGW